MEPRHVDSAVKFQVVRVSAGDCDVATSSIPKTFGSPMTSQETLRLEF